MPDRYGDRPDNAVEPITPDRTDILAARRASAAIDDCRLCDDNGDRAGFPCDHTDHTVAAKRGMDMIRATMGWTQP